MTEKNAVNPANASIGVYTSAVIRDGDKFLLLHDRKQNVWLFAGGKPEPGESMFACMHRELIEELDIVISDACLHDIYLTKVGEREWLGVFYNIPAYFGTPRIREPEKHDGLRWMTVEEIAQYVVKQPEMGIMQWLGAAAKEAAEKITDTFFKAVSFGHPLDVAKVAENAASSYLMQEEVEAIILRAIEKARTK